MRLGLCLGHTGATPPPTPPPPATTCGGACIDTNTHVCASGQDTVRDLCPMGGNNVQCCTSGKGVPKTTAPPQLTTTATPQATACSTGEHKGRCLDKNKIGCEGGFKSGQCPGSAAIVCCPRGKVQLCGV